jgi:hypothetical protein
MRQISRKEAESIFKDSRVVSSDIEQDQSELRVTLSLNDDRSFVIEYNSSKSQKKYFIKER